MAATGQKPRPAARAKVGRANTIRLMDLLFYLQSAQSALTKTQLMNWVDDYREAEGPARDRMFERDKAMLREMGVELQTTLVDREERYLLTSRDFVLPQVDFSPGEREVLAAAGRVWSAHAVGEESRHALAKLAAAGVELNAEPGSAFQPSLNATDPGFHELWRANSARQRVRFTYRNNNGEVRERDLEPWVMAQRGGAWYVMGFDRTRGDSRKFKLARIVSTPEPYGLTGAYDVPADLDTAALVAEISPEEGQERAVLAIRGDYAPSLRRSGEVTDHPATPDGYTAHAVTYGNDRAFSQTLAPFGSDVLVLEPLHLRATLIEHFERVIAAHSGGVDTERGLA